MATAYDTTTRIPKLNLGRPRTLACASDEQLLLDVAIVPVVGSCRSSSTTLAYWVTDGNFALRFSTKVSSEGELFITLRRVRATEHVQEMCWAALQQ